MAQNAAEQQQYELFLKETENCFTKPGIIPSEGNNWSGQPGTLREWASFSFRKQECTAVKMKAWRADKYFPAPGTKFTTKEVNEAMAIEGLSLAERHGLKVIYSMESAEDFIQCLFEEARRQVKDGETSDLEAIHGAIKKLTSF